MFYLNAETVQDLDSLYTYLASGLGFPEYFGKNLDALYDCLTEVNTLVEISIDWDHMNYLFGNEFSKKLRKLFARAARNNPYIMLF